MFRAADMNISNTSLTPAVVAEALSTPTSVVISYHPPIFRPLEALTLSNPLQASLLKCAAGGISVFTPHTALDCVKGGINDWLASGFTRLGKATVRAIEPKENSEEVGSGRILVFQSAIRLENIISSMKTHLQLQSRTLSPRCLHNANEMSHPLRSSTCSSIENGSIVKSHKISGHLRRFWRDIIERRRSRLVFYRRNVTCKILV